MELRWMLRLPDGMPQVPGIIFLSTGRGPGETGIYGPSYRLTYTESTIPVVLGDYPLPEDVHIPELEPIDLCSFLNARGAGMMYIGDPGSWGGVTLRIRGRQADGIICPTHYHKARGDLERVLQRKLGVEVLRPEELWDCSGVPPDLLVREDGHRFI